MFRDLTNWEFLAVLYLTMGYYMAVGVSRLPAVLKLRRFTRILMFVLSIFLWPVFMHKVWTLFPQVIDIIPLDEKEKKFCKAHAYDPDVKR
jgi:hypothetical protein